ncbi:hypothetical protein EVAR_41385_1 [Eumeta japonica]|uniref:Uncharacterized protein n=1 Tax=Eumeta variegata TaxID=151549 RepID=A0A4C1X1F9_EUMVA|nr:hypothetical protein EVAR_41385_1 [Eumeta japonica]
MQQCTECGLAVYALVQVGAFHKGHSPPPFYGPKVVDYIFSYLGGFDMIDAQTHDHVGQSTGRILCC